MKNDRSPLDIVRAGLCALAWSQAGDLKPVHILRIAAFCKKLDLDYDANALLETLNILREAERLPNGYWAPTPSRQIALSNVRLIISSNATQYLQESFKNKLSIAGAARVVSINEESDLPYETIESWMGAPTDTLSWYKKLTLNIEHSLLQTTHPDRPVEVYCPWLRTPNREIGKKRWRSIESMPKSTSKELMLCRISESFGRRWIFAIIQDGTITKEKDINEDRLRLLYALNLLNGESTEFKTKYDENYFKVKVYPSLPEEEMRLILALGREGDPTEFEFSYKYQPLLERILGRLGITLEMKHD